MKFIKIALAAAALVAAPVLAGNAFAQGFGYGYGSPYGGGGVRGGSVRGGSLHGRSYHPRSNFNYSRSQVNYGYRGQSSQFRRPPARVPGCGYGGGYGGYGGGYAPRPVNRVPVGRSVGIGVQTPGFSLNIGRYGY